MKEVFYSLWSLQCFQLQKLLPTADFNQYHRDHLDVNLYLFEQNDNTSMHELFCFFGIILKMSIDDWQSEKQNLLQSTDSGHAIINMMYLIDRISHLDSENHIFL